MIKNKDEFLTAICGRAWYKAGVRFDDLLISQKQALTNGCGGKGGWFRPPSFCFRASCNQHDFNYFLGGTEADRRKADRQFLTEMYTDCKRYGWLERRFLRVVAYTYYSAVRTYGRKYFNYHADIKNYKG